MATKAPDVTVEEEVATTPPTEAEAKEAALMMLLHRHGGSLRLDPGALARLAKQHKALSVRYDSTGDVYVQLAVQEA